VSDTIVQLTGSGTYSVPANAATVTVLVVAGGGGGASNQGGGGGAGGLIFDTSSFAAGDTLTYSIGAGGFGGPSSTRGNGSNGANTAIGNGTTTLTAIGGGGGSGSFNVDGFDGGSGGGGDGPTSGVSAGGSGTPGQGNDGATSDDSVTLGGAGGGGGGAGSAGGFAGGYALNSTGGDGLYFGDVFGDQYGDSGYFAGGGGGSGGTGGLGGGGAAATTGSAESGVAATGGGAGAGSNGSRAGGNGGSGTILIKITTGPSISEQPQSQSAAVGDSFTLSVTASAPGSLSYQWYRNGQAVSGATDSTLVVPATPEADGDEYYVEVSDGSFTSTSDTATLTVTLPALTILTDLPAETAVTRYTYAQLEVSASNLASVQWYEVGEGAIEGETGTKLSLYATPEDTGREFYASVVDVYGQTADSATTTLMVVSTALDDQTTVKTPSSWDASNPQRTREIDWSGQIAAVETEVIDMPDYEFSGRTFYRKDRLRNPR
jgi:hypothetical protein